MYEMMNSMVNAEVSTNNLKAFKEYLDNGGGGIDHLATIRYSYDLPFDVYTKDENGAVVKSDVMSLMQDAMGAMFGGDYSSYFSSSMGSMYQGMDVWEELLPGKDGELISDSVKDQYDIIHGSWPQAYDEVVLFVNSRNELSDLMLYSLGYISAEAMDEAMNGMMNGGTFEVEELSWSYEELCETQFKLILPGETFRYDATSGTWVDMSATKSGMELLFNSSETGTSLKVVGIARPNEDATSTMVSGAIGYTSALTQYAIDATLDLEVVRQQLANPETDVILNLPFATGEEEEPSDEEKKSAITDHLATLSVADKAAAYVDVMSVPADDYVSAILEQQMAGMTREAVEEMIVNQYAAEMGVDAETIMGYIAEMSDEELFAQIETAMDAQIRQQYAAAVIQQMAAIPSEQLAQMLDALLEGSEAVLSAMGMTPFTAQQYNYLYDNYMPPTLSESSYEDNLDILGHVDPASPSTISIYATTFADKDHIADLITEYNNGVTEEDQIEYTDYVALLMSSITSIISGISYLLIAFVSISLIVSSIMIGVITLISVQERTKEIGILRAVGASKKDVSRVFNAETFIVGLCAGLVGIGVSLLLTIPINAVLLHFTGIAGLKAVLPWQGAVALIAISAVLTIIAGLIPSKVAAKKDPVEALRTE